MTYIFPGDSRYGPYIPNPYDYRRYPNQCPIGDVPNILKQNEQQEDKIPTVEELKKQKFKKQKTAVHNAIVKSFNANNNFVELDFVIVDELVDHLKEMGYTVSVDHDKATTNIMGLVMIKHVMFDIETLGTEPGSVVTSLGAVAFYKDGEVISSFETYFNIQEQLDVGITVSANTILWWLKQSEEAKNGLVFGQEGRYNNVADMLINFDLWVADHNLKDNVIYWANGASFDFPILERLYSEFGEDGPPWKYHNQRCFRTIKSLPGANEVKPEREGVHHDALDDAKFQMNWLINIDNLYDGKILE